MTDRAGALTKNSFYSYVIINFLLLYYDNIMNCDDFILWLSTFFLFTQGTNFTTIQMNEFIFTLELEQFVHSAWAQTHTHTLTGKRHSLQQLIKNKNSSQRTGYCIQKNTFTYTFQIMQQIAPRELSHTPFQNDVWLSTAALQGVGVFFLKHVGYTYTHILGPWTEHLFRTAKTSFFILITIYVI